MYDDGNGDCVHAAHQGPPQALSCRTSRRDSGILTIHSLYDANLNP